MYNGILRWSDDDVQWLQDNRVHCSLSELADHLNRSVKAVRQKIKSLELPPKKKLHFWSHEEDNRLKELYGDGKTSLEDLAKEMGRSPTSIRLRANRILSAFRSDRHLRATMGENFYLSLKCAILRGSAKSKCCLCEYSKHIQLHHIDGDRGNNVVANIASLCPNHHVEVTFGEHANKSLFCIWWRVYSDSSCSEIYDNLRKNENEHES